MEHAHGRAVQEGLAPLARDLRHAIPDVYPGGAVRAGDTREEAAEAKNV
jgi:hypothetical protein